LVATTIAIIPFLWQAPPSDPEIKSGSDMPDEALRAAIGQAHRLGFSVLVEELIATARAAFPRRLSVIFRRSVQSVTLAILFEGNQCRPANRTSATYADPSPHGPPRQ
jgi:hypothetical protein